MPPVSPPGASGKRSRQQPSDVPALGGVGDATQRQSAAPQTPVSLSSTGQAMPLHRDFGANGILVQMYDFGVNGYFGGAVAGVSLALAVVFVCVAA